MAETLVYMREAPGLPSVAEQKSLLRRAGVDPEQKRAWLDEKPKGRATKKGTGFPERDRCVHAARRGDTVWVPVIGVFGVSTADALRVFEALAGKDATVRVASDGLVLAPGAGVEMVKAARRIEYESGLRRTNKARLARGKRAKLTRDEQAGQWTRAKEMWPRSDLYTAKQVEAETAISVSTLYRAERNGDLPPRNAQPVSGGVLLGSPKRRPKK